MSDEKFTQGEWVVDESVMAAVNCGQKHIAMINIYNDGTERAVLKDECLANANLISAAPDMYRALLGAKIALLVAGYTKEHEEVIDINAALAKADGEGL